VRYSFEKTVKIISIPINHESEARVYLHITNHFYHSVFETKDEQRYK